MGRYAPYQEPAHPGRHARGNPDHDPKAWACPCGPQPAFRRNCPNCFARRPDPRPRHATGAHVMQVLDRGANGDI